MEMPFPEVSKNGFVLPGSKAHVILLHGYTGSPYDLRMLADFLASHDVKVTVPLLRGHGTDPKELLTVTMEEWFLQCEEIIALHERATPLFIGGLSMGALLAVVLAARNPWIEGLLLFSPAFVLNVASEIAIVSANLGVLSKNVSFMKVHGSDILDPVAKKLTPAYDEVPVAGLMEFDKVRTLAIDELSRVSRPAFVAFAAKDGTISVEHCKDILHKDFSERLSTYTYDQSKHIITLDYDKEALFNDVWDFLLQTGGQKWS